MSPQPAWPREISDLIAWAARLSRTGLGNASPGEVAAYLAAKASLLERIAAERAASGWTSHDIDTARQAAAGARVLPDAQDKRGGVTVDEHRVCAFRAFRRVVCSRCRRVAHGGGARGAGIAWMSLACAAGPGEGMGMPGTGPGG